MIELSAIVPTCNRPHFLQRALRSILAQTLPAIEIIVVNDGSDDLGEMHAQMRDHSQLKIVRNDRPPGPSGARNTGATHARGDWVVFLDDDDEWLPDYLAQLSVLIRADEPNVVLTTFEYVFDDDRADGERIAPSELDLAVLLVRNPGFIGSNLSMRRELYRAIGGFDETMTSAEDMDLGIRLSLRTDVRYRPLRQPLIRHHHHGEARICLSRSEAMVAGIHRFFQVHRDRMTEEQQRFFIEKSRKLWDIDDLA